MASSEQDERLTIAPIVGPDDPRRFTDSGIEIDALYSEAEVPKDLELGLRFGWGLNETSPNFFANTGFGYRY